MGKTSQVDEVDSSVEVLREGVADSHGNGGLPDAARAKQSDKPLLAKPSLNFAENGVAPDHPTGAGGQDTLVVAVQAIGLGVVEAGYRADKRIASALDSRDIAVAK